MISAEKLHQLGIGTEWSEPLTTAFTAFGINDFKQQGDMHLSEPLISDEDKPFVIQVSIIGIVSLVVFLIWG